MDPIKINIPRVLTFTKVNSSKLNNSLHVQYHRKQYELVMDVDHTKLKFPAGLPEAWNTANPVTTTATTYTSPQSEPQTPQRNLSIILNSNVLLTSQSMAARTLLSPTGVAIDSFNHITPITPYLHED